MWVIFNKADNRVVSTSPSPGGDAEKADVIREVAQGLEGSPSADSFDAVEVSDPGSAVSFVQGLAQGRVSVATAKDGSVSLVDATPEATAILATTNARDFHPVDNVPLLPGDGTSFLTVTLQKVRQDGLTPLTRVTKDNEVIWLRTDHGSLREDKDPDPQEIRSVKLAGGTARFRIYSENAKRLVTVQMLSSSPALRLGSLQVELT